MKRLSFIVMACLLVLGLTQCKKNESTNNNNTDDNRVSITLQLTNGGQKVHPEEENGLANVIYDEGDVVYVGSDGKYVGYLTYNGTLFTGSINAEATEGQPLQFIFMGGQTIEGLTENSSTECIFNIGDQSNGLAVISGAASNEDFSLTNLSYTAYLRNKCALVRFDLGEVSTDAAISLTGMKSEATIGFNGTVTNLSTTGDITTYGTGSTRYAVVLSDQEAVTEGTVSAEGYEGTFSIPTAAYTNAFLTDATMTLTAASIEYVDLGLPSGLLWATCNIGANAPEGYGDYFAWGETTPKDTYTSDNYTYSDNPAILPSDHDAATANWGSDWRMPTKAEWQELYQNTTHIWTTQNGVNGRLFTASNGNSLFLPAAGYRWDDGLDDAGVYGDYWSSSLYTDWPEEAWFFYFGSGNGSGDYGMSDIDRAEGHPVRPVRNAE